jgi:hypothetical protein
MYDVNEQVLYVKGYIPPTAPDLRTQLMLAGSGADVVNSVSIFGTRQVDRVTNEVTSFDLWSLDWTPKGRAGMATELVTVAGEQAQEAHMDRAEILRSVTAEELPDHVQESLRKEGRDAALAEIAGEVSLAGEMRIILELDEGADPEDVIKRVGALVSAHKEDELEVRLAAATEEIASEMKREAVVSYILPRVSMETTDEELAAEIAAAGELPFIKVLDSGDRIPVVNGSAGPQAKTRQGTAWV